MSDLEDRAREEARRSPVDSAEERACAGKIMAALDIHIEENPVMGDIVTACIASALQKAREEAWEEGYEARRAMMNDTSVGEWATVKNPYRRTAR